jgi:hypothetical protein
MRPLTTCLLVLLAASAAVSADEPLTLGSYRPASVLDRPAAGFARLETPIASVLAGEDPEIAASRSGMRVRDGRLQVEIVTTAAEESESVAAWLRMDGALEVVWTGNIVEAWVSPEQLRSLDTRTGVSWVRPPVYGVVPEPGIQPAVGALKSAIVSEGVVQTNVEDWHQDGFTGDGIKVGVIDIETYGWESLVGTELPDSGKMHFQRFGFGTDEPGDVHGTAVAEIVHDMAPDAEIFLARIGGTFNNFNSAIQWMIDNDVRVIAMSISYFGISPKDGTGAYQSRIDNFVAVADGVWAHSAGNRRQTHWRGGSVDPDGNGWVEMAPGEEIIRFSSSSSEGDEILLSLQWNDWTAVDQDYSLHLFRVDGDEPVEVAAADRFQTGSPGQRPSEWLSFTVQENGRYGVGIFRKSVTAEHDMEIFALDNGISGGVETGSITTPGDAAGAMGTAALSAGSLQLRSFSSAGPTNGPGGSFEGGDVTPEIAAYDGVSTASYGTPVNGTSFACPHVAGAAAVVMSAYPEWTGAQVRSFLAENAIERKPVGKDNDTGWGRLSLRSSPLSTCTYSLDQTVINVGPIAGPVIINVDTTSDCFWVAEPHEEWMKLSTDNGTGSGRVGVLVENNEGPNRTGTLTVAGSTVTINQEGTGDPGYRYLVAGIAETGGAAGTRWKSNLAILNAAGSSASVDLIYRHSGGEVERTLTLAFGEIVEYVNVAADLFGTPDSAGVVEVRSDTPVVATARTFNDAPTGTFGQLLPGVESSDGVSGTDVGALSQLTSNAGFRTNIGFVNFGDSGTIVRVRLFDGDGNPVGSDLGEIVGAGEWWQVNRVFREANAGNCTGCYALVDLIDGDDGPVWAYASVVDNGSGDPTTIPMEIVGSNEDEELLVAGIAETGGAAGTRWKSNLAALNLSGTAVTGTVEYRHSGGTIETEFDLDDSELIEWENIAELLGAPNSAGAVFVASDEPLIVTARTFNDADTGTFGQFLPGLRVVASFWANSLAVLTQIKRTDDFRTNVGFTNYGQVACDVEVTLYGPDGAQLGSPVMVTDIPPGGWKQQNRIFREAGVAECQVGWASLSVESQDCGVWAYASVVDNRSGDPTTIPVTIPFDTFP